MPSLVPLTPEYDSVRHEGYLKLLNKAVQDERNLNIALTGPYGAGKSSILSEFVRQDRSGLKGAARRKHPKKIITLSMSTLGGNETLHDSEIPDQALTTTNIVQQEIVKQLLYRQKTHKAKASRFRRIERFRALPNIFYSITLGLLLASIVSVFGWDTLLATKFGIPRPDLWANGVIFGVFVVLFGMVTLVLLWLTHGRVNIKQLTIPSASVSLEKDSISYFDQYLDEIIYYFETSGTDAVILEDMDRFNESHIFETLLALNKLINNSSQVTQRVRFIYAVKDSIFESTLLKNEVGLGEQEKTRPRLLKQRSNRYLQEDEEAISLSMEQDDQVAAELRRANRTKFFDLIMPVVPFATYQNSRNLLVSLMDGIEPHLSDTEKQRFNKLYTIAGKHVPDMRILKNIRNEYVVYRDIVFPPDGADIGLEKSKMFAMVLFKNLHLSDFEAIPHGRGSLNLLYDHYLQFKEHLVRNLSNSRDALAYKEAITIRSQEKAIELGWQLMTNTESAEVLNENLFTVSNLSISDLDRDVSAKNHRSIEFWDIVAKVSDDSKIILSDGDEVLYSGIYSRIRPIFDAVFDSTNWIELSAEEQDQLRRARKLVPRVSSADFRDLYIESRFRTIIDGFGREPVTFEKVVNETLNSDLARTLVGSGFLDRNFVLYTSAFYEDFASAETARFQIMNLHYERADFGFFLTDNDVRVVLEENIADGWSNPGFRNFSILSFLIKHKKSYPKEFAGFIDEFIPTLDFQFFTDRTEMTELDRNFLVAFVGLSNESVETRTQLIQELTPYLPEIFDVIAAAELIDRDRMRFISNAFDVASNEVEYQFGLDAKKLIGSNPMWIHSLNSREASNSLREITADILERADVSFSTLDELPEESIQVIASRRIFEINRFNLHKIVGKSSVALDELRVVNKNAFRHVALNFTEYLDSIITSDVLIADPDEFASLVNSVDEYATEDVVKRFISQARPEVMSIEQIGNIDLWPSIVAAGSDPLDIAMIHHYLESRPLDLEIVSRICSSGIKEVEPEIESEKSAFVLKSVLEQNEIIENVDELIDTIGQLLNGRKMLASEVPMQVFHKIPHLVEHNLLEDSVEVLELLQEVESEVRLDYSKISQELANYLDEGVLSTSDASLIFLNETVPLKTKVAIAEKFETLIPNWDKPELRVFVELANSGEVSPEFDLLLRMADYEEFAGNALDFSAAVVEELTKSQIHQLLQRLSGEFAGEAEDSTIRWTWRRNEGRRKLALRARDEGLVSLKGTNGAKLVLIKQ